MKTEFFRKVRLLIPFTISVFLSACQSTSLIENHLINRDGSPQKNNVGFLSDYSKLKQVEGDDGQQVLRWVNPEFYKHKYKKLNIAPLVVFPIKGKRAMYGTKLEAELGSLSDDFLNIHFSTLYEAYLVLV